MPHNLRDLIRASGNAGSSGQTFRNHVAAAASGASMRQYLVSDWDLADGPDQLGHGTYSDGQGFSINIAFTQGIRAQYIKRTGNVVAIDNISLNPGFRVESTYSNILSGPTGTAGFTLRAPMGVAVPGSYAWYDGYAEPNHPIGIDAEPVLFRATVLPGANPGDSVPVEIRLSYAPDIGPFNYELTKWYDFQMFRRSADLDLASYGWEWYYDNAYSNKAADGPYLTEYSYPNQITTRYLRYQYPGSSWVNLGPYSFEDNRH